MAKQRHEDHHADVKHREAVFSRFRGELMREGSNPSAFIHAKARIMAAREVQADPALAQLLQTLITERELGFKIAQRTESAAKDRAVHTSQFTRQAQTPRETLLREARQRLAVFHRQFHENSVHFHIEECRQVLVKIRAIVKERLTLQEAANLPALEQILARMKNRLRHFDRHVDDLAEKAIAAAKAGHHEAATRTLKRLATIHALHPAILTEDRFIAIRERIVHTGDNTQSSEALHRLLDHERAVAAELQQLARRVRMFHEAARSLPHDATEYKRAELDYQRAVREIESHDSDWLASLILELLDLLAELHDPPPPKAQAQVDRFVESVRAAIATLHNDLDNTDQHKA